MGENRTYVFGLDTLLRCKDPFKPYLDAGDGHLTFYISPTVYSNLEDLRNQPTSDGYAAKEALACLGRYMLQGSRDKGRNRVDIGPNSEIIFDLQTDELAKNRGQRSRSYRVGFLNDLLNIKNKRDNKIIVVTSEPNIMQRCMMDLQIECKHHPDVVLVSSISDVFRGYRTIHVPSSLFSRFKESPPSGLTIEELIHSGADSQELENLECNEYIIGRNSEQERSGEFLGVYCPSTSSIKKLSKFSETRQLRLMQQSVHLKNAQQCFALEAALNPAISLLFLTGKHGTGKTYLSVIAALYHVVQKEKKAGKKIQLENGTLYSPEGGICVVRSTRIIDEENLGFLPGGMKDKYGPWVNPISDQFVALLGDKETDANKIENLKQIIEPLPIAYLGGRSIQNRIVLVEEAQNMTQKEIRQILSRGAKDTKFIISGDYDSQIERLGSSRINNGLVYGIQTLKGQPEVAVVHLSKIERGRNAELADLL